LFGWRAEKPGWGVHLNRRFGEHAQIPHSDAAETRHHAFMNRNTYGGWQPPAIYSPSSNAESVVLIPIATQNLNILKTLGCPNMKAKLSNKSTSQG
jgi:hypothetical protein